MRSVERLGKKRSRLGIWLDQRGISQKWLSEKSGVNKNTISKVAANNRAPQDKTIERIMKAINEVDPDLTYKDFWDI